MRPEFRPLFKNPHLLTIAGNFWPRKIENNRFPATKREYRIDDRNAVVAFEHQPLGVPRGQVVFVHGLEGSADAGYIASFAQESLSRGFGVHRLNLRTCGGTEELCETMYHSGLTGDTRLVLETLHQRFPDPLFLVGFSLGGNIVLKLAGELGQSDLLAGVVAVSTPIDLAQSVRFIDRPGNFLYVRRFLDRLRQRVRRKNRTSPELYKLDGLDQVKSIWEFDDRFTAPLFGFGTAANYYETQSAKHFLEAIRLPALVITAKDDPLVPFDIYQHPAFTTNSAIQLVATEYGGHLGYLSKKGPRFWVDHAAMNWIEQVLETRGSFQGTNTQQFTSA